MGTRRLTTTLPITAIAVALLASLASVLLTAGAARAAIVTFTATLTAAEEVPTPGPDGATGSAVITIDDETNEVCYELTIDGIAQDDAVVAAHIHVGEAGVAGDVVVPLFTEPPTGEMTGCVQDVDPATVAAIVADPAGYYVNIHSEQFAAGAVRGQLVVSSVGGACSITVSPTTVADGGQFTVSGDFGAGAEIHMVFGEDANLPEDSEPLATIPADQSSFSVTFTVTPGSVGTWTVFGFIPASECGDSATLTVTAATVPNTAAAPNSPPLLLFAGVLLLVAAGSVVRRAHRVPTR